MTPDNTLGSYIYGKFRLFLAKRLGPFERGYSSEAENCTDLETSQIIRLDHLNQSLKKGDLAESVRLADAVLDRQQKGISVVSHQPELMSFVWMAKNRLVREENVKMLQVYTDRLIELNKKHGLVQQPQKF